MFGFWCKTQNIIKTQKNASHQKLFFKRFNAITFCDWTTHSQKNFHWGKKKNSKKKTPHCENNTVLRLESKNKMQSESIFVSNQKALQHFNYKIFTMSKTTGPESWLDRNFARDGKGDGTGIGTGTGTRKVK